MEDLIEARRRLDVLTTCDPQRAPRLAPAMNALRILLARGGEFTHAQALNAMLQNSDLTVKTCQNMISRCVRAGLISKSGKYLNNWGKTPKDTRAYEIADWPAEDNQ